MFIEFMIPKAGKIILIKKYKLMSYTTNTDPFLNNKSYVHDVRILNRKEAVENIDLIRKLKIKYIYISCIKTITLNIMFLVINVIIRKRGEAMADNTGLPFNQIEKSKISLLNSKTSLFIIGNGFDLMHGIPSSYYNFRDFLGRNNGLRNALETYIKRDDLWADLEESLAHLDDEAMKGTTNDMMDIYEVKEQYKDDFSAADFFMAAEAAIGPAQTIMSELPGEFREWISTLKSSNSATLLAEILSNESRFINFNYTEFLETIYKISQKNIWYIHGDRRENNKELILGHVPGAQFEDETDPNKMNRKDMSVKNQTAYDLRETAGYGLIDYYDATTKKSTDVIKNNKNNKNKFETFTKIENIVVIGHSLSEVDYLYFEEIIKYNHTDADINWYISWYSSDDLERVEQFVSEMDILNSKVRLFKV